MSRPEPRRADLALSPHDTERALAGLRVAHLGSVGADGEPYVVPSLFVWTGAALQFHGTAAIGHFRRNLMHRPVVCFEACEAGTVYPYGEFACDLTTSYVSVIGVGPVRIHEQPDAKAAFFDRFLPKYADPSWDQPKGFYPRLDQVVVYELVPERLTGKHIVLPPLDQQWPARNRTKSPGARPSPEA
jgi:nitroimidazol reductase NimA-like FMN-containing flavoprotein (pyridoxamine 5'-phosphate oxidase superfamily)